MIDRIEDIDAICIAGFAVEQKVRQLSSTTHASPRHFSRSWIQNNTQKSFPVKPSGKIRSRKNRTIPFPLLGEKEKGLQSPHCVPYRSKINVNCVMLPYSVLSARGSITLIFLEQKDKVGAIGAFCGDEEFNQLV